MTSFSYYFVFDEILYHSETCMWFGSKKYIWVCYADIEITILNKGWIWDVRCVQNVIIKILMNGIK